VNQRLKAIVLTLFYSGSILAGESLRPIEVTPEKRNSSFGFETSEVYDEEDLKRTPNPTLVETLKNQPNVMVIQDGGPGGRTSFFIRGAEAKHVSFTLDELKLNDASNTDRQFDGAFVSAPGIKEVRLHEHPGPVIFGSDATGGLIEMITKKGEAAPRTEISLGGGSFGTYFGSLSQDWSKDKHRGSLSYTQSTSQGISRLNKKRFNATEKDGYESLQILSSSHHEWDPKWSTDFLLGFIQAENDLDLNSLDSAQDEGRSDQYLLQQKTKHHLSKDHSISLRTGMNRHQRKVEGSSTNTFSGAIIQNEMLLASKISRLDLLTGLSHENERSEFSGYSPRTDTFSLFSQGVYKKKSWEGIFGLRGESNSRFGEFGTGTAGVKKIIDDKSELALQYSRGYKSPSLFHLFDPNYGSADLRPETLSMLELKAKRKWNFFETEIILFQSEFDSLITFTNSGYRNQNEFTVRGVEGRLTHRGEDYLFYFSGIHQDFESDQTILKRPRNQFQLSGTYFLLDELEIYSRVNWVGARRDYLTESSTVKLNSYETVEIGSRWEKEGNSVTFQIQNVLDKEYENTYGFSTMPRSFFISLGKVFN
jgi:vitamin B12 transporter